MPGELEPSKEDKMAQDWRRGQRSQELECEDNRRQSVPRRTSAGAGSGEEPSTSTGTHARTRDRRTRRPEVQMYVPRPMRNRLKRQEDTINPSVTGSAEATQSETERGSSEIKDKKSIKQGRGTDRPEGFKEQTEKLPRGEKSQKSHRESLPRTSKKHRSAKEHTQGNDRGKKDDVLRQKGTKEIANLKPDSHRSSDRQVYGKERENIKKQTVEVVRSMEKVLTQPCSLAVASDCDGTEPLQSAKDLSVSEEVLEFKETPEEVTKKESNVQDDVHSLFHPRPASDTEEQQVIEDSNTAGQENVTGYTDTKSAEGITSPSVPNTEIQSPSRFEIHKKASSGFTEVKMSFQDDSGKTELCDEVVKNNRVTETKDTSGEECLGDQSRMADPEQTFNGVETDGVLTVTKGIETEMESDQTLPVTSTQLAGDKTPNDQDVPVDTRSVTEVVDMTVGSETPNPEDTASSLRAGECTVLTDKQNSEQNKGFISPKITTPENSSGLKNPNYDENEEEDNSEEFWDAEMELKGRDVGKEDDVMTGEQEATCEDGQQGVAVAMKTDEDSWDAMFDDDGECLDPDQMTELLEGVQMVKVTTQKPKHDYWNWKPKEIQLEEGYEHIVELSDFPAEFKTPDLVSALSEFQSQGFNIKWVDDTHALAVFSTCAVARRALQIKNPLLRVKPMSEATQQSKKKAKNSAEFLQPFKPRPEASAMVARRLVSGALGVRASIPKEKREEERRKLKEAKERKRLEIEQRESAWEGR